MIAMTPGRRNNLKRKCTRQRAVIAAECLQREPVASLQDGLSPHSTNPIANTATCHLPSSAPHWSAPASPGRLPGRNPAPRGRGAGSPAHLLAHDLIRKPVPTFRDHAHTGNGGRRRRQLRLLGGRRLESLLGFAAGIAEGCSCHGLFIAQTICKAASAGLSWPHGEERGRPPFETTADATCSG